MEAVERTLRLLDRIEVEQRLARVLVGPVAGVDYRNLRYLARVAGRSLDRVAHDDQVAIVRYDHDRVMEGLAFRYARVGGLGKSDDPPPEVVDRALEAEARAGRRLEEKRGDYFSGEHLAVRIGLEPRGQLHDLQNLLLREIGDRDQIFLSHMQVFIVVFCRKNPLFPEAALPSVSGYFPVGSVSAIPLVRFRRVGSRYT